MTIVTIGIDLAKNVFAVHGVDATGKAVLVRPSVARAKLLELMASIPACLIGMEACSGAHQWAREFVCFVPVKTLAQQGQLTAHRARQGFVEQRTATLNRIRGLLAEFGVVLPLKASVVRREALQHLDDLPGVSPTTASALMSTIGNGRDFRCGRQLSAWLGLVPGQYSSGGKARLGRITKAGDPYLRSLLVLGARAVLQLAKNKTDPVSRWANALAERRGYWRAVVAIAAKNARMCWAILNKGEAFRLPA